MSEIVLKDRNGIAVTHEVPSGKVNLLMADGTKKEFVNADDIPTATETTVDLDFSGGAMTVTPEEGNTFSKVIIPVPENLTAENIAKGVDIAGITGTLTGGGGDLDKLIDGSITELSTNAKSISDYFFYYNKTLEKINIPNVTKIGNYAFYHCDALKEIDVSHVQSVGEQAFRYSKNLTILDFGTSLNSQIGKQAFSTDGPVGVIIRNTTMIPDASNANNGYLFGRTTQRLYVPRSMVATWKASNYMKTYHADQVVAIEDYPDICG